MSNEGKPKDSTGNTELDELLDSALADFDEPAPQPKKDETTSSQAKKSSIEEVAPDGAWSSDFIKQTTNEFEKNLQNILQNAGLDLEESLQKMTQTAVSMSANSGAETDVDGMDFQAAIAQTLKDLSTSTSETLKVNPDGLLTESELAAIFGKTSLEENAGDMFPFMEGMMQSLLSKEILYPSLKDLVDKYPGWLDSKKDSLRANDLERFTKQLDLMKKVCQELETEKDDDAEDVKKSRYSKILSLMQEMQNFGQPPEELMGEQTGALNFDGEGNPVLPSNVNLQNCSIM